MDTQTDLVVRKAVTVHLSQEAAFRLFTEGIGSWWPGVTHSVAESSGVQVVMDGAVRGHIYERTSEGTDVWGTITEWNPPVSFSTTWHPGHDGALATRLLVRFVADGPNTTRVELEHRGWEIHAAAASEQRASYDSGWEVVLGRYLKRAGGRT